GSARRPTPDAGPRTSDVGPRTSDVDVGRRTSDLGPRTSDLGRRTSDVGPRTSDLGIISRSRDATATYLQALGILGDPWLSLAATPRHRDGRRDDAPGDVFASAGPRALAPRHRAAGWAAGDGPFRQESDPPLQAPSVSGDPEARARRGAAAVPAEPRGLWHRSARPRRPVRRGQLGGPDPRRLGHRLAGAVRRPGDHAVHLLPAGRRHRSAADRRRADLRARALRDGVTGR